MTYQVAVAGVVHCVGPKEDCEKYNAEQFGGLGSLEYCSDNDAPFRDKHAIDAEKDAAEAKVKAALAATAGV